MNQNYFAKETKCTHHAYVETLSGTQNFVVGTERGNIKVYNFPLINWNFDEFNSHHGEVT